MEASLYGSFAGRLRCGGFATALLKGRSECLSGCLSGCLPKGLSEFGPGAHENMQTKKLVISIAS